MSNLSYEGQYFKILKSVLDDGFRQLNARTGVETIRIPHSVISVDLQKEFPILRSKQVFWKTATREILWIMQQQSNNINDLKAHIWDEWADEDGSIGKAYGYQIAKPVKIGGVYYRSQIHYIIERLNADSSDRRAVIDLWDVDDLDEMRLVPCCYSSVWDIIDNKLHCMLVQRSADYLVGVPFNTTQYAILTHLLARHLGVEVGQLTHCMADTHVYCYDSHLEGADKMMENYGNILLDNFDKKESEILQPKLTISPDKTNFFDITIDDIKVENYEYVEKISFDVAV